MKTLIKSTLAIITFGLILSANTYAGEVNAKAEVETLNKSWNQAFNNANAGLLASMYSDNALVSPGNGKLLNGPKDIENLFKSYFEAGLKNHKLEIVSAVVVDKTLHQVAKWSASGADKDGAQVTYRGITTSLYQRDLNGKWVAHSHIWNAGN
ncbi:MAG: DUF4440 domain-containing protein [Methylotenera sp.]|nr:DUF4440 domain-containing protein [Methylotenera sp.]MDO9233545.1 DUF4440 domain-containing protein [Methylotenera sp.]MDP2103118.1 DUF4440 domain-containing protein [Methylotenera sp.]MDP2280077.1 DUF4440 domain-containing protein [Methylotenera sp.]MDP2403591.1 DUF4440 domain-containing protein [Methylotenera sp.]